MFQKLITIRMLDMKRLILAVAILIVNTIFADVNRTECPSCLSPVRPTSKFCASCGRDLNKVVSFVRSVTDSEYYNGKKDSFSIPDRYSGIWTPMKISLGGEVGIPYDANCSVFGLDSTAFISQNYSVYGVSVSSIGIVAKEFAGIGATGLMIDSNFMTGIYAVGGMCRSDVVYGMGITGLGNISKEMHGISVAGFANGSEDVVGLQIAGGSNLANKLTGIQICGLRNDAGENSFGFQIGLGNKMGKNSKGLQLGLLNWFDDSCFPLMNMRF